MAFKCQRWTCANLLPVAFVLWVIGTVWGVYTFLHLAPLLRRPLDVEANTRGVWQAAVSQTLTAMLVLCLLRAIFTDPGSVPESPEWRTKDANEKLRVSVGEGDSDASPPAEAEAKPNDKGAAEAPDGGRGGGGKAAAKRATLEYKQTGERRFCKWCDRFKPDRCHHCRVCRSCILRMDHHCPWIANCVGFRNHKFFFLLVFYSLLCVLFMIATMIESVERVVTQETTPTNRFLLVFGMTLGTIMAMLLMMFFPLHLWLMMKAMTTIEFCEKRFRHTGPGAQVSYDVGFVRNARAVLGPYTLLWFLPLSPPEGSGLFFEASLVASLGSAGSTCAAANGQTPLINGDIPPEITGAKASAA